MNNSEQTTYVNARDYTRLVLAGKESFITLGPRYLAHLDATARLSRSKAWNDFQRETSTLCVKLLRDGRLVVYDNDTQYEVVATPYGQLVCNCKWVFSPKLVGDTPFVQLGLCRHVVAVQCKDRWHVPVKRVFPADLCVEGGNPEHRVVLTEGALLRQRLATTAMLRNLKHWDAFVKRADSWHVFNVSLSGWLCLKQQRGSLQASVWGDGAGELQCDCHRYKLLDDSCPDAPYYQFGMCEHVASVAFSGRWVPVKSSYKQNEWLPAITPLERDDDDG